MPAFRRKPLILEANRLTQDTPVETPQGVVMSPAGSWVMQMEGGLVIVPDDVFRENFEPVGKEGVKMMVAENVGDVERDYIIPFPGLVSGVEIASQ